MVNRPIPAPPPVLEWERPWHKTRFGGSGAPGEARGEGSTGRGQGWRHCLTRAGVRHRCQPLFERGKRSDESRGFCCGANCSLLPRSDPLPLPRSLHTVGYYVTPAGSAAEDGGESKDRQLDFPDGSAIRLANKNGAKKKTHRSTCRLDGHCVTSFVFVLT